MKTLIAAIATLVVGVGTASAQFVVIPNVVTVFQPVVVTQWCSTWQGIFPPIALTFVNGPCTAMTPWGYLNGVGF